MQPCKKKLYLSSNLLMVVYIVYWSLLHEALGSANSICLELALVGKLAPAGKKKSAGCKEHLSPLAIVQN